MSYFRGSEVVPVLREARSTSTGVRQRVRTSTRDPLSTLLRLIAAEASDRSEQAALPTVIPPDTILIYEP